VHMTPKSILCVLLALLFMAPQLQAQRTFIENTIGVGPHVGWYQSNDAEDGALYFGFQARLRYGRNVGFEIALDYRDNEAFDAGRFDPTRLKADVMYVPLTASLMIFAPVGSFLTPYGLAGLGWYYTITDYELINSSRELRQLLENEDNFEMGYHFGLGLEIPLSQNFTLHGDARYLFLGTEIRTVRDITTLDTDTDNSDGIMFNAGFMIYL
ncbi:MAG: outer membrane beta-barrel protein, partial [Bacteroidota bacterium]|nr:outer membrane beta-barrel protein [Bacteroidota bacterium]